MPKGGKMKKHELIRSDYQEWVLKQVKTAKQKGIQVSVDGKIYNFKKPEEIFLVMEDSEYMQDYIGDKEGNIITLCFDKIRDN
jgi:bifunctional ADP-heptose synthase (sugar kinase/adenylyltransferase)